MNILRHDDPSFPTRLSEFLATRKGALPPAEVSEKVRTVIERVRRDGDTALCELSAELGGPSLTPDALLVPPQALEEAWEQLPDAHKDALTAALENIHAFARCSLRQSWSMTNAQGAEVGERFDPLPRIGVYIPGGSAPLVSSVLMTAGIAQAAGVPEIVAATPPAQDGSIHPALLGALHRCGVREVLRSGGAQAIAAMVYGTPSLRPVTKVFGPGSIWVVEAKRQLFGVAAVDLLPGPSEILIVADETARADWVAADLLAQAEHGHGSQAVLVTTSAAVLEAVHQAIHIQLGALPRRAFLEEALAHSVLILAPDVETAISIANAYAAEHTALAVANPDAIAPRLTTSGALFLGHESPVALGDFLAGPSHELPTGGSARSFAGLTADQFQRRTSFVRATPEAVRQSLPHIAAFSEMEGLAAHGQSVAIRAGKPPQ